MTENIDQNQDTTFDPGLAKYIESNLQAQEEAKLTDDQWVEKTWDFLTVITNKIENLPQEIQQQIVELGKKLASVGAAYQHDQSRHHYPPVSPAKLAMITQLKAQSAGAGK